MATAYEQVWKSLTVMPGQDFAGKRYTFVKLNSSGLGVAPAAGDAVIGVNYEENNVGQPAQTVIHGVAFIKLGATIAAGAEAQTDAAGAAIPLATGKAAGIILVGGVAGDIGSILLK
ncbi:hypothetical protein D3C76_169780 [compost metagenome]